MLKQLKDVKTNKIFVLQTAGQSMHACKWLTAVHAGTAEVCNPALSLF